MMNNDANNFAFFVKKNEERMLTAEWIIEYERVKIEKSGTRYDVGSVCSKHI